jgi:uncharacterized protein (DUF1778 family)
MNTSRTDPISTSQALPNTEARSALRTKTVATRLTPEELAEIEEAAERDGKTLAEWMRQQALKSARQVPADPMELVLSEVAALRYMLLTLFHSTAQARREGVELLPETVLQIRDAADRRKLQTARKMLDDFMNQNAAGGQP